VNIEQKNIRDIIATDNWDCISETNKIDAEDVYKILKKASSSFRFSLSKDELMTCSITALWKAVEKYCTDSNCKFTTYLYKGVVMECLSQKKFNKAKLTMGGKIHPNIKDDSNQYAPVDMIDEINFACEDPKLIVDRYYKNMSIKEIALSRGCCGETIRIKINKNLKKLELSLLKGV